MLYLNGSHTEIGQQYGESCREQIHHSIATARKLLEDTVQQIHQHEYQL
jgi:hypothetical protein